MPCQSSNKNEICDLKIIAERWGTSEPYSEMLTLDGTLFIYECVDIQAIDKFLMSECSLNMNSVQVQFTRDLIAFEDNLLIRNDLKALDDLFLGMILTGQDCITYQGALSGCN
ncbi:MAG: hypothetical protein JHC33_00660 [Ignisphaera sp.]|nr:hypothetical protein [Ignisphaera sp.]